MEIGCDIGIKDSRISTYKMADDRSINYQKPRCSLITPFDVTAQVEADMIANHGCDEILDVTERLDRPHTLHPVHGCDPKNAVSTMSVIDRSVSQTIPYVHATYNFTKRAIPFMVKVAEWCTIFPDRGITPPSFDETVINCMLWKHGVKTYLNCYDPSTELIPFYLGETTENKLDGYYAGTDLSWHIFHGSKDVGYMRECFRKLRDFRNHRESHIKVIEA